MNRVIVTPRDEEHWLAMRKNDVTSSDCHLMVGHAYELWQEKHCGVMRDFRDNIRIRCGNKLEAGIAELTQEEFKLMPFRRFDEYIRIPEYRIGSSFDFQFEDETIYEIKQVDQWIFKDNWVTGYPNAMPEKIEWQVQQQMFVSGRLRTIVGVLVGGNVPHIFVRYLQRPAVELMKKKAWEFWNAPCPDPLYEKDAKCIAKMHANVTTDTVHEIVEDDKLIGILEHYLTESATESAAKKYKESYKAQALEIIGESEEAKGCGFTVSAGKNKNGKRGFRVHRRGG